MKKVGFVDIKSKSADILSGNIYVFAGGPGNYKLESVTEYSSDHPLSLNTSDISDFTLSLPVRLLNFRVLNLPFSEREKLQKIVPFELGGLILEHADNVVFDVVVLGQSGDRFDVLVTYTEKAVLQKMLSALSSANVDPLIVTSIELQVSVSGGVDGLATRLVTHEDLTQDERIAAALNELRDPTLNMRTGTLARTRETEKVKKKLKRTVALLIALALLINSYLIFEILTAKSEASAVKKELRTLYTAVFPAEKRITDELYQMKSHIKETKEKGDVLVGVRPLQLLLELSQKTPRGVVFNEIGFDRGLVTLKGEATSMNEIDGAKARLSEFLGDMSVSDIRPSAGDKTLFTMVAKGRR
ncbi:MAG TPA: GspL/Epsl periplasmic domain-containing protein [Thermodesulfovibrionales bacterium]|nr:GspL/Epsl periplasmic domain-containing protein [Thermodesulfovibrionales bacterium]